MSQNTIYFNRELSWLSFNYRVLQEAADEKLPLYERIKFLAIYSSNLEEFFRVRVASIRNLTKLQKTRLNKQLDFDPKEIIRQIYQEVNRQHQEFEKIFKESILPGLYANNIILYQNEPLLEEHQKEIAHFFRAKILSYLQPVFIADNKKNALFLQNDALYFVLSLRQKYGSHKSEVRTAYLNIPSQYLGRFIQLSEVEGKHYFIFIEDIIRKNLDTIFPGYEILGCYCIKMDRDGGLAIEDEYSGDLVAKVKEQLNKRNRGAPTRFLYEEGMPGSLLNFLKKSFNLDKDELATGGEHHNLDDLMKLPNPLAPKLVYEPLPPISIGELDASHSIFESIRQKDRILHFPYHSYDYVLRFFNEAAIDPCVREVKVTLYRIASNSLIANALITAAKNGKKVTVFVEVKARFDEANNLRWAEEMERAGIHIIYSIPGLKVHAKIALVRRVTPDGKSQGYAYFGTGNFNERTAEIYADHGLFTSHPGMIRELQRVFNHLAGKTSQMKFKHLLVAQFNLQDRFLEMLDREIQLAKKGKPAKVVIKINNLEDKVMINKLYEASQAGVGIELIARGICCLVPGVKGMSENIKVTRIVDRFLEHARVFWFHNNGKDEIYLSSADWMKRNLYKRIEVGFPIYDELIKAELKEMINFQLRDTAKASLLNKDQQNVPVYKGDSKAFRSQIATYDWLKNKEEEAHTDAEENLLEATNA